LCTIFDGITRKQSGVIQFCDGLAGKQLMRVGSSRSLEIRFQNAAQTTFIEDQNMI
jgi:hypothetical protein